MRHSIVGGDSGKPGRTSMAEELKNFLFDKKGFELKKFTVANELRDVLLSDVVNQETWNRCIDKLYRRYFRGFSNPELCSNIVYLDLMFRKIYIEITRKATASAPRQESVNRIAALVQGCMVRTVDDREITTRDIREMTDTLQSMQGLKDEVIYLVSLFRKIMIHARDVLHLSRSFSEKMNELGLSDETAAAEYRERADELFCAMKRCRRYSIRESYFQDDCFQTEQQQAWAILDPRHAQSLNPILAEKFNGAYALFFLAKDVAEIEGLSMTTDEETFEAACVVKFNVPFVTRCNWELGHDGHLYMQTYPYPLSIKKIFEREGKLATYEILRLSFIARVFDLTVPRSIVEQTPSLEQMKKRVLHARAQGLSAPSAIRDIIVPRSLLIRDTDNVDRLMDTEMDSIMRISGITRTFLGRIGHPRWIRQGYRAPEFLKQAAFEEANYTLQEGETWCRFIESPIPVVHRQISREYSSH